MGSTNSKRPAASEEVKYLSPTGLYPSCNWDLKTIRKLIIEKKLAPFYPGREEKDSPELDECPICFMVCPSPCKAFHTAWKIHLTISVQFYAGGLNRTKCCHKGVCTGVSHPATISPPCRLTLCFHSECFLQIKKPGAPLADSMYVSCGPLLDLALVSLLCLQLPLLQSCALHGHIHGTQVARGTDERRNGTSAELVLCAPAP
jgi:hypothetical protein